MSKPAGVRVTRAGGALVITPGGNLWTEDDREDFDRAFQQAAEERCPVVVVNCGRVDLMNSICLGVLITASLNLKQAGTRVVLCCLRERFRHVLTVLKALPMWEVHDTEEAALAAGAAPEAGGGSPPGGEDPPDGQR